MSYSVHYCPEFNKKYPSKRKKGRITGKQIGIVLMCLALLFAGRAMFKYGNMGQRVQKEKQRISVMLEQIREGTAVSDAFTTYCVDVLKDAEIY